MANRASFRLAALALCATATLAGCGRKGPLELPPDTAPTPASQAADAAQARTQPPVDDPGLIQPPNKTYQVPAQQKLQQAVDSNQPPINRPSGPKPGKPFVLDPLL